MPNPQCVCNLTVAVYWTRGTLNPKWLVPLFLFSSQNPMAVAKQTFKKWIARSNIKTSESHLCQAPIRSIFCTKKILLKAPPESGEHHPYFQKISGDKKLSSKTTLESSPEIYQGSHGKSWMDTISPMPVTTPFTGNKGLLNEFIPGMTVNS